MKEESPIRVALAEINGKEFSSYPQLLTEGMLLAFNSHLGEMPPRYTYINFFEQAASNGWIRQIADDKYKIQTEEPELDQLRDSLRKRITSPIEDEIFPTMVFMKGLGFSVYDGVWKRKNPITGLQLAPFVEVDDDFFSPKLDTKDALLYLLIDFYQHRKTNYVNSLTIVPGYNSMPRRFSIQSVEAEVMRFFSDEEQKDKRSGFEVEMTKFTKFIKEEYMSILPGYIPLRF